MRKKAAHEKDLRVDLVTRSGDSAVREDDLDLTNVIQGRAPLSRDGAEAADRGVSCSGANMKSKTEKAETTMKNLLTANADLRACAMCNGAASCIVQALCDVSEQGACANGRSPVVKIHLEFLKLDEVDDHGSVFAAKT
jgi:hypothetical protein